MRSAFAVLFLVLSVHSRRCTSQVFTWNCTNAAVIASPQTGYYGANGCSTTGFSTVWFIDAFPFNNIGACISACSTTAACLVVTWYTGAGCSLWGGTGNVIATNVVAPKQDTFLKAICTSIPTSITNGNVAVSSYPCFWGDCTVSYSCNAGYVLSGPSSASCIEPSSADSPASLSPSTTPTCSPAPFYWGCTNAPANGNLNNYYGARQCASTGGTVTMIQQYLLATFSACSGHCNGNANCFFFTFDGILTCKTYSYTNDFDATNNANDNYDLYVKATCAVPTLANGQASASLPCYWGSCTITYSCNNGYTLSGASSASCTAPGTANAAGVLSPSTVPVCNPSG